MNATQLLYPVFVQVALTFVVLFWMGRVRLRALQNRELKVSDIALGQPAWPARVTQISNTYQNQFELPMLFFALVAFALIHPRTVDIVMIALAWAFVITRLVHAGIYTTTNAIRQRFTAFLIGGIILLSMWILFAVRIVAG
jgi:hypothetical protein